jgi:hypothetical protein
MEPEEFSRVIGQILGSGPITMDDRTKVLDAMGEADSIQEMPADVQQILSKMQSNAMARSESRAIPLSKVERSIIKDSDKCPLCVANNDPKNVPVHPNCHCDVVTDSVETGMVESGSRLLDVFRTADGLLDIEVVNGELPEAIQLNGETVAVFDATSVRFGDLARWLEQMEPYLNAADQYLAIVVDDDTSEALQQAEETLSAIAANPEEIADALKNKKLWLAITKAVAL